MAPSAWCGGGVGDAVAARGSKDAVAGVDVGVCPEPPALPDDPQLARMRLETTRSAVSTTGTRK